MSTRRKSHLALYSLLLSSCALGPNYHPPVPPSGSDGPFVSANANTTTTSDLPVAWWQLYNDPVLNGLIEQAFSANENLKTAEANLAASRAIYEGARTAQFPATDVDLGAEYGRDSTTDEIVEIGGGKPQTGWIFDSLLDVSYELDLFGHVRRTIEAARDNAEVVAAERDDLRVTIAAETARAYGQICTLGEEINVAQQSVAIATRQLEIVQGRKIAGAGSDFEVVRSEVLVAQVRAAVPPLQGQRNAALFELAALLGETPSHAPTDVEKCVTPPRLRTLMPVGDGTALLRRRPDIREADRKLAVSLAQVGIATADLFPRITLGGFYGGASDQINMLGSNSGLTWGVGPAISWSFPNMSGPLAKLSQAKAGRDASISNFNSVVLQALKETEQALSTYQAELDHHAMLTVAQTEATKELDLAQDQYQNGTISSLDLLNSNQTRINADAAVAVSDAALVQDQIAVFKALGGGWQVAHP
jgi:NodT family efflux transporter outer membrane factor (OMF) lipoprotein